MHNTTRILVTGSDRFHIQEAIARSLLDWWLTADRPSDVVLVTEESRVGQIAVATWQSQKFGYEVYPKVAGVHDQDRDVFLRMMSMPIAHAFVFAIEGDLLIEGRELALQTAGIPTTTIRLSEYRPPAPAQIETAHEYPFLDGEVLVLGPGTIRSGDGQVVNFQGQNYYTMERATELLEEQQVTPDTLDDDLEAEYVRVAIEEQG